MEELKKKIADIIDPISSLERSYIFNDENTELISKQERKTAVRKAEKIIFYLKDEGYKL